MNDEKINITLKKELNILIINDYPIMAEAYEKILLNNKQFICNLEISACYELAIDILNSKDYDILFIDLQLDSSEKGIGISGEKLAIWTRNRLPETKIMLIMSENKSRVNDIIKTIPHDGFLIKKCMSSN